MIKKFSKTLFKKYDTAAKSAIHKIFKDFKNYTVVQNEKKYGVDFLIFNKEEHIGYLEVEVKTLWSEAQFPYSDVNWPERKAKYAKLDKPTIFLIFSKNLDQYLTTTGSVFLKAPKEIVRNKYIKYGEYFYKIAIKNIIFNNLKKELSNINKLS